MTDKELLRASKRPQSDVMTSLSDEDKVMIEDYAEASGISFNDAVAYFAEQGVIKVRRQTRSTLRGR